MVLVFLPSDALSQHLSSYLGFSYLGHGVSLHGCSSKAQPLLLTLDEGYLLTATHPDLECGVAPLGPPAPTQQPLLGVASSGLPWWLRSYSVCLQCGRPGFDPWVGKIPWRRKWQPTPVFLPGESRGRRSLVGPQGRKESDTTE